MSEYELENIDEEIVDVFEDEESTEEVAEAKKASMGDPSEVPDAPTSKTDEKKKGSGDPMPKITTKVGMINAMMDKMKKMKKDDLQASYGKMIAMMNPETVKASYHEEKEVRQITREDLDISEDVSAIFKGEDLSEEFVSKATTIFEAAVISKVNEVLTDITTDFDAEVESGVAVVKEEMVDVLDKYLSAIAEDWMEQNELAVENSVRTEIVENFMVGLRNLFAENYIDIPEEKVDLVDELAEKVSELEASLNEEMERNIELREELIEQKTHAILKNVCSDLTESQSVKMKSLSEGVEYDDEDAYYEKLMTIKNNYFPSEEDLAEGVVDLDEEPLEVDGDENVKDRAMQPYLDAISRSIKK